MPRKENRQPTKTFDITIPQRAYGMLSWLAKNSVDGATENEVAASLLREKIKELLALKYHETFIPDGADSEVGSS